MGLVNLRNASILIALADDARRVVLEQLLKKSRFSRVLAVPSAVSTIQALKSNKVDILICDLDFKDIPGVELIKAARAGNKKLGVVALGLQLDAERKEQARSSGANHAFSADLSAENLLKCLDSMMMSKMGIAASGVVVAEDD